MSIIIQELLRNDLEIKTALLSVFDKTGLEEFARFLVERNVRLISTGGTFKALSERGIPVLPLTEIAPFAEAVENDDPAAQPEIFLDGRVKTLQPEIFGGLLASRANPMHIRHLEKRGITKIDLLVANFYPFQTVAAKPNVTIAELLENIDIGGPSMAESSAKNHDGVCVIPTPANYQEVMEAMRANGGKVPYSVRAKLAASTLVMVGEYRTLIGKTLAPLLNPVKVMVTQPVEPKSKITCLHVPASSPQKTKS